MRQAALLAVLTLTACAPVERSSHWLVGAWVLEGDSCQSDAGVEYRVDGTWHAYGTTGRWRLSGDRLESTVTERWEDDGQPLGPVVPPERYAETVTQLGPDRFRSKNGDERVFVRCPA